MKWMLSLFFITSIGFVSAQNPLVIHYEKAKEAYEKKDYDNYLFHTSKADSISPNHPTLTYNLASGYALTGNSKAALELLKKTLLMNIKLYPTDDPDFHLVRELPAFEKLSTLKKSLETNVANSQKAFVNKETDLHPESIVYDPLSKTFLIGSVHKNKIISYDPKSGTTNDWKRSGEDGLWAVMGMKVDAKNNVIWVCTTATREMTGFTQELSGKTALYQYDLKSKKLLNRYELDGGHWFGDLILTKDGIPLVSDSMKPIIYTVKDGTLTVFKDFTGKLYNLQGLAFNTDESIMYIADYKIGIQVYYPEQDIIRELSFTEPISTKGSDGLYFYKNRLISIQNGVFPFRVCTHKLSKDGSTITRTTYIDRGRAELDEPTLGVIVDKEFYYIANSPWGKYDKEGNMKQEELTENIILSYGLDK